MSTHRVGPLVAQDIRIEHDGQVLFTSADLTVGPGETVAVTGTGPAPRALLFVLAGLCRPAAGWVQWDGQDIHRLSDGRRATLRRRTMGLCLEPDLLFDSLPVLENIALPLMLDGVPPRESLGRAADLLDRVGLSGLGAHGVEHLPRHRQVLVAVARAVVTDPRLVLVDDPTPLLGRAEAEVVLEVLLAACAHLDAALVLATTSPASADRCGRVLAAHDGRLRRAGDLERVPA